MHSAKASVWMLRFAQHDRLAFEWATPHRTAHNSSLPIQPLPNVEPEGPSR
jgi:hypothetical protein